MRLALLALISLCAACFMSPRAAVADGKVFMSLAEDPSSATMPDQQALIYYKNGVQTLVIETRFVGAAEKFAWVVPLPAAPEVARATTGLFKTLRAMHQPKIERRAGTLTPLWVVSSVMLLIILATRNRLAGFLWAALLLFVAVVLFMPALGKARGGVSGVGEVTEVSRQLVGDFDVTVISSRDPDALTGWLHERGFGIPAAAKPVIAAYVAEGWVFAAARMTRGFAIDAGAPVTPHPLAFTFPTNAPVYPMRLTGVENAGPLRVDLYVLADQRAAAPGFSVERCGEVEYIEPGPRSQYFWGGPGVRISHEWLREHAPSASVATKLTGTLEPAEMTSDIPIAFEAYHPAFKKLWTRDAATARAIDVGLGVVAASLFILVVIAAARQSPAGLHARPMLVVAAAGALAGGVTFASTDQAGATRRARDGGADSVALDLAEACYARKEAGHALDAAWLRETAALFAQSIAFERHASDAAPAIEEDSPGNYRIVEGADGWWFVWYDFFGNEHRYPL